MTIILSILFVTIATFTLGYVIGYKVGVADGESDLLARIEDYFRRYAK